MKIIKVFIVCLFVCGCVKNENLYKETDESREKLALCNIIRNKVAVKLKKEKNLSPIGFGGQAMDEVVMLALSFVYFQPLEIVESRELLIYCIDSFVDAVNKEGRIRGYLKNYPFEPKNVEITIYLYNPDGSNLSSGLQVILSRNGVLEYEVDDPNGPFFETVLKETYQEALQEIENLATTVCAEAS